MKRQTVYTKSQTISLLILRYLIGWHILYEGIAKALNPQWSSLSFLQQSQGLLSGFARWVVSHPDVLSTVDFLNTWGLILIGLGLIFGLFAKTASFVGAGLVFIYYLNAIPFIGSQHAMALDGNYLLVDKTLIEAASLCVLGLFPTSRIYGIDGLIDQFMKQRKNKKQ